MGDIGGEREGFEFRELQFSFARCHVESAIFTLDEVFEGADSTGIEAKRRVLLEDFERVVEASRNGVSGGLRTKITNHPTKGVACIVIATEFSFTFEKPSVEAQWFELSGIFLTAEIEGELGEKV